MFQWALSLPLTLLFVVVASSATTEKGEVTREPIGDPEDFIGTSLQQPLYPTYIRPFRNAEGEKQDATATCLLCDIYPL